ncbi:transcription factor VBP-like [Mercenaria mercenaria]|uniref:transcription factor VBP-like n=1 Tax=Mercenaria mercenaria TaxID=6596 RepID=UPI00234E96C1|nr:transcription factor VBP-like [Mercenaria mercenaria]XP_045164662.2 transcription factor VBP-like [Mercenaria mercenaria]XP_045164663.2 transcription factor VBP-like [Mercenaria mercenaria]
MQDPYSAMMSSQQRTDHFKSYQMQRQNSTTTNQSPPGASSNFNMSYMHGLQYGTMGSSELYNAMTMPSSMAQEFSPLPAHIGSHNSMNSNAMSRINPTTHTITNTATSANASSPPNTSMPISDVSSPGPSSSRLSMSPDGQSQGGNSHISNQSPGEIGKTESSDSSSVKSGNEDDNGIPPKKRALTMPEEPRDDSYWEKRKKNNESAKRSREARRMKEEQIALRVVYLEQENLQLRTEVSLLKGEIEKLRCMLYNS